MNIVKFKQAAILEVGTLVNLKSTQGQEGITNDVDEALADDVEHRSDDSVSIDMISVKSDSNEIKK